MSKAGTRRRRPAWRWAALGLTGLVTLVLLLEGVLSLASMVRITRQNARPVPADHRYTHYDSRLGWVMEEDLAMRDAFGAWRTLSTDGRGLRVDRQAPSAQGGEADRITCVGGSAVFGIGVGDEETWCHRVGLADADFTSVNLGQPGHDAGQSYLFYRRMEPEPSGVVIFAITDDTLEHVVASEHKRFPKPRFDTGIEDLDVQNVPVPRRPYLWPWGTINRDLFRSSDLLRWLLPAWESGPSGELGKAGNIFIDEMLTGWLEALREKEGRFLLVYLPDAPGGARESGEWQLFLESETRFRDVPYLDLNTPYKAMPQVFRQAMFYSDGFLTPFAHYWIAGQVAARLAEVEGLEGFDGDGEKPWLARYYAGAGFSDPVAREWHPLLAADWAAGAPAEGLSAESFSAVFDSCLPMEEQRRVKVMLAADGSAQLAVNGQTVLDTGETDGRHHRVNTIDLPAGMNHLRVRYAQSAGVASVRLVAAFDGEAPRVPGPERLVAPVFSGDEPVCRGASGS